MDKKVSKLTTEKKMSFLGHELVFGEKTLIMGILNLTPDSFSDGGQFESVDMAVAHAKKMLAEGADIIDVGGESSRPGHKRISADEECARVIPVIKRLSQETNAIMSIDTIKEKVALEAIKSGAHIINDIWGFQNDKELASIAAKYETAVILMHNKNEPVYKHDIMEEIKIFLKESVRIAIAAGVKEERIVLDPGIGFGKTFEQNLTVLRRMDELKDLGYPILLGISRKSFIGEILDVPPIDRDEGSVATNVLGISQGVDIIRVHNVPASVSAAKVADRIVRRID